MPPTETRAAKAAPGFLSSAVGPKHRGAGKGGTLAFALAPPRTVGQKPLAGRTVNVFMLPRCSTVNGLAQLAVHRSS